MPRTIHKKLLLLLASMGLCASSFAKAINLYDQPDDKAKAVGTVDLSAGIIPILTPKGGNWIKVADPRNGNVGWIKSNEMNADGKNPHAVTFTQRIINDGTGPQSYQIIQYGGPTQKLNPQDVQKMVQRMQIQHQAVQDSMQKAMQEMVKDMNNLYKNNWEMLKDMQFPMIMPIIIMPSQSPSIPKAIPKHESHPSNVVQTPAPGEKK